MTKLDSNTMGNGPIDNILGQRPAEPHCRVTVVSPLHVVIASVSNKSEISICFHRPENWLGLKLLDLHLLVLGPRAFRESPWGRRFKLWTFLFKLERGRKKEREVGREREKRREREKERERERERENTLTKYTQNKSMREDTFGTISTASYEPARKISLVQSYLRRLHAPLSRVFLRLIA